VNEYNLALRKPNTQGAQEEAAKYLKTPYDTSVRSASSSRGPKSLSESPVAE
jgi:hypothetical protein